MEQRPSIFNSLKLRFIFIFIFLVILPFSIMGLIIENQLTKEAISNSSNYFINNLEAVCINTEEILKNIDFVYTPILSNATFLSSVKNLKIEKDREFYADFNNLRTINDTLSKSFISNNYIDSIYLYSYSGKTFFSNRGSTNIVNNYAIDSSAWFLSFKNNQSPRHWIISKSFEYNSNTISSYREVREFDNPTPIGLLSININERILTSILSKIKFKTTGYSFVSDIHGNNIISSTDKQPETNIIKTTLNMIPKDKKQGYFNQYINNQLNFITYYVSDYSGFYYIAVTPMKEVDTASSTVKKFSVAIYLFLLLTFTAFLILTNIYFLIPMKKLFSAMKVFEKGDFSVRLDEKHSDEIGYINKHFNEMVNNLKELVDENYINKLLKKDAQLKSIQSQINEHFLYNTLDSIHWIAREYKANKICDLVFSLSKFYRLSLSNGKDIIKIKEIVDIIDNYIFIQKFRMQEALECNLYIDDTLLELDVLKYLFQPIIENAIVHGISKKDQGGIISVSFKRVENLIRFQVEDTGVGINSENLKNIIFELENENDSFDDCFALRNINMQLKLFYGNQYSLKIESTEYKGTKVWFDIPFIN